MSNFLQFTVFGIMLGAGYAIAATGLVVTYTTSGVFNFAQGAVGMIAAFGYWELVSAHHQPTLVALLIVLILGASIAGAFVERVLMRRLHGASAERPVMVTLGLMVILTGMATVIWSPTVQRSVEPADQRPVPPGRHQHPVPVRPDHRGGGRRGRRPAGPLPHHPHRVRPAGRGRRPRAAGHVRGVAQPDEPVRVDPRASSWPPCPACCWPRPRPPASASSPSPCWWSAATRRPSSAASRTSR